MNLPKTVGVVSLGCSKNRVDTENMLGILAKAGITPVADPAKAEIIIVNTCGFILPAREESIDAIFDMARYKTMGTCKLLFVTGCLSQRYPQALKSEMPEVDAILGVGDYPRIVEAIEEALKGEKPVYTSSRERFFECGRVLTTPGYSAYVKISDGCDNRCSYCAIPLIRGSYSSRPYDDAVNEMNRLAKGGVTEITLIAQDTSRYGNDFPGGKTLLAQLIKSACSIDSVKWVRTLYCYPDTVDERLLDVIAGNEKACNYLDLPLQHINADILKRMNRRGSPEYIRRLIDECRSRNIIVRTTMMVGFPGETDEQFEELMEFVEQARFARLGAFTFSPEEGTPAFDMPGQIDEDVKKERLDRLMTLQRGISASINASRVGSVEKVLVEGRRGSKCYGRSSLEAPEVDPSIIFTPVSDHSPGDYVFVSIDSSSDYDLYGHESGGDSD
ncbi:MAG: 30S ribosomal protein S12 methylthiotransferase RimO [Clostridia bacterium]|nr:30S ribosomal protein S12 methylthiotransferase RimO [Clostridia bacterium]